MHTTLYRGEPGNLLFFQTWIEGNKVYRREGHVGRKAETKVVAVPFLKKPEHTFGKLVEDACQAGFHTLTPNDHCQMVVQLECPVEDRKSVLDKVYLLERELENDFDACGIGYLRGHDVHSEKVNLQLEVTASADGAAVVRRALERLHLLDDATLAVKEDKQFRILWPPMAENDELKIAA